MYTWQERVRAGRQWRGRLALRPVFFALAGLQDQEQQFHEDRFDHYLLKPADPGRLVALLAGLCRPV